MVSGKVSCVKSNVNGFIFERGAQVYFGYNVILGFLGFISMKQSFYVHNIRFILIRCNLCSGNVIGSVQILIEN